MRWLHRRVKALWRFICYWPWAEKRRVLALCFWLIRYKLWVRWPFKVNYHQMLGKPEPVVPVQLTPEQKQIVCWFQKYLPIVAKLLPTHYTCLMQALAVRHLFRQAGIPCYLILGVRNPQKMEAHAWLQCGELIINCGSSSTDFASLAGYA